MINFLKKMLEYPRKCSFVEEIKSNIQNIFNNFITLLGYDINDYSRLFEFQYNSDVHNENTECKEHIQIFFEDNIDGDAEYIPEINSIIINNKNLMDILNKISEKRSEISNSNDEDIQNENLTLINIAYSEFIKILFHEIFHSLTKAKMSDGLTEDNFNQYCQEEQAKFVFGHSLEEYTLLLSYMLTMPYVQYFGVYIPLKFGINEDNTFNIVTYNKHSKTYDIFEHLSLDIKINGVEDYFVELGRILNNPDKNFIPSQIISSSITREPMNEESKNISSYYHQFSGNILTKENVDRIKNNEDFVTSFSLYEEDIVTQIHKQEAIDEIFTEALVLVATYVIGNNSIDLELINENIQNDNDVQIDVKLAVKLLSVIGEEFLHKYLTSANSAFTYFDFLRDVLADNYSKCLDIFFELYLVVIYNLVEGPHILTQIQELDNIIEELKLKRKL